MADSQRDRRSSSAAFGGIPAVARLTASAWWHGAEWTMGAAARIGSRIAGAALDRNSAPVEGPDPQPSPTRPESDSSSDDTAAALRQRGEELLRRSAEVTGEEDLHPAYARILDNLSPDEARILRLFATAGPQPAIDIRRGLPFVTELVAPGINMIGSEAGCRKPDQVPAYLNNLYRLGLLWFSRETLRDRGGYHVLEAQPEATEALEEAGRTARTVHRSIHLTPFGADFCRVCLPLETAEIEALGPQPHRVST
jgi:Abortive infection alpha